jgi:predicted exporter
MNPAVRARLGLGIALLGVVFGVFAGYVRPRLNVETDLLDLLPRHGADEQTETAIDTFSERLSRKVVFLVGAGRLAAASAGARAFATSMAQSGAFIAVREQVGQELAASVALYFDHRATLLSRHHEQALESGSAEAFYRAALLALYTPAGMLRPIEISRDPLGLGSDYLLEQIPAIGNARVQGSQLVVSSGEKGYVVVIAETAGSPFSRAVQDRSQRALQSAQEAAEVAAGAELTFLQSGALQHATVATRRSQNEVAFFGTVATVAVLGLMLLLFRDWRAPALGMLALAAGAAAGISATHFAFGELHLIALVFGSSLVGVAIDYSMHFYADQFRSPGTWTASDALGHVSRPIVLGMGAAALGYTGLLLLPFPGLKQMALISIVGLGVACASVLLLFPALARGSGRELPRWCATLIAGLERAGRRLAVPRTRLIVGVAVLGFLLLGLARVRFHDDVRSLQMTTPELAAVERRVGDLLGTAGESRFFLVSGSDAQSVLEAAETLTVGLHALVQRGAVDNFVAVSNSLPSHRRQEIVHALLEHKVYATDGALPRLMRELGFEPAAIARELASYRASHKLLEPDEWLANPLSAPYRDLWLGDIGGRVATVVTLTGVHDVDAVRNLGQLSPDVRFVDRVHEISSVLARYRNAVGGLLLLAYALIFAALAWRYGLRDAGWLIAAPLGASALTLAFAGAVGATVNLFAVLGLLLVLALGVDYAIFLREGQTARSTALLAVSLSATTTMLSFGLLAFSSTPLIRSIGFTLLIGIGCCWLIAVGVDAWRRGQSDVSSAVGRNG